MRRLQESVTPPAMKALRVGSVLFLAFVIGCSGAGPPPPQIAVKAESLLPTVADIQEPGWEQVPLDRRPRLIPFETLALMPACDVVLSEFSGGLPALPGDGSAWVSFRRSRSDELEFLVSPSIEVQAFVFHDEGAARAALDRLTQLFDGGGFTRCFETSLAAEVEPALTPSVETCDTTVAGGAELGIERAYCLYTASDRGSPVIFEAHAWQDANVVLVVAGAGDIGGVPNPLEHALDRVKAKLSAAPRHSK